MEIEIITTKKKLTKSLLDQIRSVPNDVIGICEVLGYLINVKKDIYKLILLKYRGEYYTIESG